MSKGRTIQETEQEIVEAFSLFDSWDDKYEYIIDLGKRLPELDAVHKTDVNKVRGCQSAVWLIATYEDGLVHFKADSDAMIVKGLVSMLVTVLSGHTPDEILEAKLGFMEEIGMMKHLAQTRSNGLLAMVKQMKHFALAFKMKNQLSHDGN